MDFRCSNCLTSRWLDRNEPLRLSDTVDCPKCGKIHEANPVPLLGSTLGSHYRSTVDFANEMQIDAPSAYSVLLQFMTLNDVRAAQGIAEADANPGQPESAGSMDDVLLPDLTDEELSFLERLDSDDGKQAQDTFFPALSETELGLLDGIFLTDDPESAHDSKMQAGATPSADAAQSPLLPEIDPGFVRAVTKGHLTLQEALRRGNRNAYTHSMAKRHELPMRLAYAVADNRITLHKAVLFRDATRKLRPAAPLPARVGVRRRSAALVIAVATTMVGLATWGLWSRNFEPTQLEIRRAHSTTLPAPSDASAEPAPTSEPPTHEQALRSATAVLIDEMGRITQVTGPDPGNVLQAFCKNAARSEYFEPSEVTETIPPSREARLGVFRDLQSLNANQAIRIRRNRQTRRWVAGDGVHPIQVMQQPDLPPGALRISVAAN